MLTSLALIFLFGLFFAEIFSRLGLPRIIGMLLTGVLLGPNVAGWLDGSILAISADLRKMALVIILIKAGLSLNLADLKKVGRPALLMAFLPAAFEVAACVLLAPIILGVSRVEAAVIGAVLGAVSPAVVVPRMVQLMEEKRGTAQGVPQLILAGASLDDVFVIVLFSTFVGMAQGEAASAASFFQIPVSIVLGILIGALCGVAMALFFEGCYVRGHKVRGSVKVILILSAAFLLNALEGALEGVVPVSGLLAVMSMACALRIKVTPKVSARLSEKFGKLWLAAEAILFVLVGAAVDIRYMLGAGLGAVLLIALALCVRSVGVVLCMAGTKLDWKERAYCVIAYLPKATVQAAIGGVPLALGLPCGNLVLSVAVLSIVLTAPLGALGMDLAAPRMLKKE